MAWTTPRTWVANEIVRAAQMNEQVRDNLDYLMDVKLGGTGEFVFDVTKYGAVGNGVTNDTAAIQAAIDAAELVEGEVFFPTGTYRTTTPLTVDAAIIISGAGREGTTIVNSASDIFNWAVRNAVVRHIKLHSEFGGGHIFNQTGAVTNCFFYDIFCQQDNDAKSIYSHVNDAGTHLFNLWLRFRAVHKRTATVPMWHYRVATASGAANENTWQHAEVHSPGNYAFHFESARDGNYVYAMTLRDVSFEVPSGGCVKGLGANMFVIDNCSIYDLNVEPAHRDLFYFGAGTHATTPSVSRHNKISNLKFIGNSGQLDAGVQVIKLEAGGVTATTLENVRQNTTGTVPIDYGNTEARAIGVNDAAINTALKLTYADSVHDHSVGVVLNPTANQSIPNGAVTPVTFNAEVYDSHTFHSNTTNPTRITIPAGYGGLYAIVINAQFAASATGIRSIAVYRNGVTSQPICQYQADASSAFTTVLSASAIFPLADGDYIEMHVYQNSGGALDLVKSGTAMPAFAAHRLSA